MLVELEGGYVDAGRGGHVVDVDLNRIRRCWSVFRGQEVRQAQVVATLERCGQCESEQDSRGRDRWLRELHTHVGAGRLAHAVAALAGHWIRLWSPD